MFGVSAGVARLCRFYGVDVNALPRPSTGCVMIEQFIEHLEARPPANTEGPSRLPLFVIVPDHVRDYQWLSTKTAYRKSGFIVAPCGSGKTLIGLLVAVLNGGRFLILTTRYVEQWKTTLELFFNPNGDVKVVLYTDIDAIKLDEMPHVVIATYAGFCARNKSTKTRLVRQIVFTTMVLDEAHNAASIQNLNMLKSMHSRYTLLLTATKVREDDELLKLEEEFGPTLTTIDRPKLIEAGHIADVKCINLIVPYNDILEKIVDKTTALAIHPNKIQVLYSSLKRLCIDEYKTLVFCDDLFCLTWTNLLMRNFGELPVIGHISMKTPYAERVSKISTFSNSKGACVLFLSRTGDEALDIPSANAGIVFWNHWGSRRQIVQRIGRIARHSDSRLDALFITLLSDDVKEIERSHHREKYITEHGFQIQTTPQDQSAFGTSLRPNNVKYCEKLGTIWAKYKKRRQN